MEMATIEEVKAGMNSLLGGMLRECFNRSDGLTELTENLQLVRTALVWLFTNLGLTSTYRKARARRPEL